MCHYGRAWQHAAACGMLASAQTGHSHCEPPAGHTATASVRQHAAACASCVSTDSQLHHSQPHPLRRVFTNKFLVLPAACCRRLPPAAVVHAGVRCVCAALPCSKVTIRTLHRQQRCWMQTAGSTQATSGRGCLAVACASSTGACAAAACARSHNAVSQAIRRRSQVWEWER